LNAVDRLQAGIGANVIDARNQLAERFQRARPFRHVVIDDLFTPDLCKRLSDSFPAFDERLAVSEDGVVGNKAVNEKIMELGPAWRELDALVQDASFRELISDITGIPDLQYDPHYFGGGTHENRHGQGLDAHVDFNFHPITRQHRRLNLIVYLNEEWRDEWGGSIQLRRNPYLPPGQDEVATVTPRFNRCVIFETTEHSWHGFPRIDLPEDKRALSRRSFALYYYTDTRPEEETGAEHSTIYVDEQLPDEFRSGIELTADRLQRVRMLLEARDLHIRRLYEDIKRQNSLYRRLKEYRDQQQAELNSLREVFQQQQQSFEHDLAAANAHIIRLDEEIRQRGDEIQQLCRDLDEKNRSVDHQRQVIDGQRQAIEDAEQAAARLQDRIDALESSTSWRITRPIRRLRMLLKKVRGQSKGTDEGKGSVR
jgi:hypothetical protein